jgi:hypothetical protein
VKVPDYDRLLEPLRNALAADGYTLAVDSSAAGEALTLTVAAGSEACESCLVPVAVFEEIVARQLLEEGQSPTITVVYPDSERM